jgi:hypothetical protein
MRALTWDDFAGAEGTAYQVEREGEPSVELTLKKAVELPSAIRPEGSFRLELRGPFDPMLPQAVYTFHIGDERHEIFIVPVARDDGGTQYEAVFN